MKLPLLQDRKGVSIIEFAMLLPVMLLTICGLIEFGYVAYARSTLESATVSGARLAMAHECPANREADMRSHIETAMAQIVSPDGEVDIIYKAYGDNFGDVGNPEPFEDLNANNKWDTGEPYSDVNGNAKWDADMGADQSVGEAGDVVSYETRFKVISMFPMITTMFNNGKQYYELDSSTVVRNEPVFANRCPTA